MSDGFEAGREQRNWLERLGEKIPGFRGFQDRELRREVDKMQREHLAGELGRIKSGVRRAAGALTDRGMIGALDQFDRLERRLDGLSQAIRFSDYGASGLFDVVKIGEPELERIYEFDLSVIEDVDRIGSTVEALGNAADPADSITLALELVTELDEKWGMRETLIGGVVQTAGQQS